MRMHERGARHVQPHRLEQHLVAVGGAVERARAGAVVGGRFGLQQLLAPDQALREFFAHLRFVAVAQAAAHRPRGHEHARQVTEMQRADQQSRHDLVAHAEQQGGVEHVVRQGNRGRHRDRVAREQAQLHAGQALRDAVAHRRHPTGHLDRCAMATCLVANHGREALVGLVRRQHVVVGGDDGDVRRALGNDAEFVVARQGGERVGDVGAPHALAAARPRHGRVDALQVGAARGRAAFKNARCDFRDG
jgi:hypothetical protein